MTMMQFLQNRTLQNAESAEQKAESAAPRGKFKIVQYDDVKPRKTYNPTMLQ